MSNPLESQSPRTERKKKVFANKEGEHGDPKEKALLQAADALAKLNSVNLFADVTNTQTGGLVKGSSENFDKLKAKEGRLREVVQNARSLGVPEEQIQAEARKLILHRAQKAYAIKARLQRKGFEGVVTDQERLVYERVENVVKGARSFGITAEEMKILSDEEREREQQWLRSERLEQAKIACAEIEILMTKIDWNMNALSGPRLDQKDSERVEELRTKVKDVLRLKDNKITKVDLGIELGSKLDKFI